MVLDPTGQAAPGAGSSDEMQDLDAAIHMSAESILKAVNVERADAEAAGLISHMGLTELARSRSTDMSVRGYTGHEDPISGENLVTSLLAENGYRGPAAELVYTADDPLEGLSASVTDAWFSDPMHKALLLEPAFRFAGLGIMGDGSAWKVTLILAADVPEESLP